MAQPSGCGLVGRRPRSWRGRRAAASLALLAGGLSGGIIAPAGSQAGAAPRDVDLICTGESGDEASNFIDGDFGEGGPDSQFIVESLNDQDRTGTSPGSLVTVTLDHDLPDVMATDDAARPVNVSGTARLSDAFFDATGPFQLERSFQVESSARAHLDGPGVSESRANGPTSTLTQPIAGPGASFPVDLDLTATPTAEGGAVALQMSTTWKLHLDQQGTEPFPLRLGTVSMTCETAGPIHDLTSPYGNEEGILDDYQSSIRLPQPLADSYVARPGGVIARTDRAFDNETTVMVDVLDNDESLDAARVIDPATLKLISTGPADHWDADVSLHDGVIMVSPKPLHISDMYDDFQTQEGGWGGTPSPPPGITLVSFGPAVLSLTLVYEVCDDGDPASCAQGLAYVTAGVEQIDPCDDPTVDIDCGPSEPTKDTTCSDDMSICEVPGCTWSDADGRYVCTYPGKLHPDPNNDPPPSTDDDPPDGTGPGDGRRPPPGVPLTPAFTA